MSVLAAARVQAALMQTFWPKAVRLQRRRPPGQACAEHSDDLDHRLWPEAVYRLWPKADSLVEPAPDAHTGVGPKHFWKP